MAFLLLELQAAQEISYPAHMLHASQATDQAILPGASAAGLNRLYLHVRACAGCAGRCAGTMHAHNSCGSKHVRCVRAVRA